MFGTVRLVHPEDATMALKKTLIKVGAKLDDIQLPGALSSNSRSKSTDECTTESMSRLELINREIVEEQERQMLVRDAEAACLEQMEVHLHQFIAQEAQGTYEEWITCLHPENATAKKKETVSKSFFGFRKGDNNSKDNETILVLDHRFYLTDSDHRRLWNYNLNGIRTAVAPRDYDHHHSQELQQQPRLCCGEMIAGLP